jgi:hypothetical protein
MKITYIAGVLAMIAFPAFAEKELVKPVKPETITVAQCESEKILILLEQVRKDILAMQQDFQEVRGDQEDSPPKKIYK